MLRIKLFNLPKVINQSQNIVIKNALIDYQYHYLSIINILL